MAAGSKPELQAAGRRGSRPFPPPMIMQPLRPGDGRLVCRDRPAGSPRRLGRRRNCSRTTRTAPKIFRRREPDDRPPGCGSAFASSPQSVGWFTGPGHSGATSEMKRLSCSISSSRPAFSMSRTMAWAANIAERRRTISASVRGHWRRSRASIASWTNQQLVGRPQGACSGFLDPFPLLRQDADAPADRPVGLLRHGSLRFLLVFRLEQAPRPPDLPEILAVFLRTLARFRSFPGRAGTARGGLLAWNRAIRPGTDRDHAGYLRDTNPVPRGRLRRHPSDIVDGIVRSRFVTTFPGTRELRSPTFDRTRPQPIAGNRSSRYPCTTSASGVHVPRLRRRAEPAVAVTAMGMKSR